MTAQSPEHIAVPDAGPSPDLAVFAATRRLAGWQPYRNGFKRLLDVTAIVIALPVVMPVMAAITGAILLDGGRPFYSQPRVGRGGKSFRMWKFRTMIRDAEAHLERHLSEDAAARAEWDATQKLRNDPRITRLGNILRRCSMDELPQLWNVLRGDMSLVGPRPMMESQRCLYPGKGYYELRPGITGSWQTAGRNRTTFEARASFDDAYARDVSLVCDLRILLRTVGTVLACTGL